MTYTGLLMNLYSFDWRAYKNSLLRTLIDRIFRINNKWTGFHQDISKLKHILEKNEYPRKLIDNYIHKYLDSKYNENNKHENTTGKNIGYLKLPYIGMLSTYIQKKLNDLKRHCCKPDIKIQLAFIIIVLH